MSLFFYNSLKHSKQILWFNPPVEGKKSEASGSEKIEEPIEGAKLDAQSLEEKKEGSDDEEIEEERSWRRGYSDE